MESLTADFFDYKIPRLSKETIGPSTSMEHHSPLDTPLDRRQKEHHSNSRSNKFVPICYRIGKKNRQPKPPVDDKVARTLARVIAMIKVGRRPSDSDGNSPAPSSSSSSRSHSSKGSGNQKSQRQQK